VNQSSPDALAKRQIPLTKEPGFDLSTAPTGIPHVLACTYQSRHSSLNPLQHSESLATCNQSHLLSEPFFHHSWWVSETFFTPSMRRLEHASTTNPGRQPIVSHRSCLAAQLRQTCMHTDAEMQHSAALICNIEETVCSSLQHISNSRSMPQSSGHGYPHDKCLTC